MNIQFFAKNVDLDDKLKSYIEEKVQTAIELIESVEGVQVDVSRDAHHKKGDVYRVEVNVKVPKKMIRAEFSSSDVQSAMDLVRDKLEAQARKYKDILVDKKKTGWKRWISFWS